MIAGVHAEHEDRENRRQQRVAELEAERRAEAQRRADMAAETEERRQAKLAAAEQLQEDMRRQALAKVRDGGHIFLIRGLTKMTFFSLSMSGPTEKELHLAELANYLSDYLCAVKKSNV